MAGKYSGISLKLFRQRAPNILIGVYLKVHRYFINDHRGRHLRHSVEGWWLHSCITFKKLVFINTLKMGKSEIRFFPNISKMVGNFGILSSNFYRGLGAYRMAE